MTGTPRNGTGKPQKADDSDIDYPRLFTAMRASRRSLERFRKERRHAVEQFVGNRYSENGTKVDVPVNIVSQFILVMSRALVGKTPRVMLSTMDSSQAPAVDGVEAWLNTHLDGTYFAEKAQRFATDALYSIGIMKVALGNPATEAEDYANTSGQPFAETISLDDFAFDPGATSLEKAAWIAHRFRMPLAEAKELGYFDKKARKLLSASESSLYNEEGDERLSRLTRGQETSREDDFEEMVDLWEIYLRRSRMVVTFVATPGGGVPTSDSKALKVQDWLGPACGPYHFLCLGLVPDNAMPKGPVADVMPLHEQINKLYLKLGQQAERQKEILPVRGGQMDDAQRIKQGADGEMVPCDNADNIKAVSFGGPSSGNLQFAIHERDTVNELAGNLRLLSGASPQSKTASQDKMLNENASSGVADMQEKTVTAISKILSAYCWYLWYHPELVMEVKREAPGTPEISIKRTILPGAHGRQKDGRNRRNGSFEQLQLRVDPYSLQHKSPQQRLAFLDQTVKDMIPIMPVLAPQGVNFDAQAYMKLKAKYSDEPDLLKIFTIGEPVTPPGEGGAEKPGMPSDTSREYIRRSVGRDTEASRGSDLSNALSEEAAAFGGGEQ